MIARLLAVLPLVTVFLIPSMASSPAPACATVFPSGKPVVNADQTVIIIWDAAAKIQHFIRKASFKSDADDFAFLVPTPTQPELAESGDAAFPYVQKLTEPATKKGWKPVGGILSCSATALQQPEMIDGPPPVKVLDMKEVAGFKGVVLEAQTAGALVGWLKEHGYAFSPEVEAWVKPYVDTGWKITALQVAKNRDSKANKTVAASSLRLSFKTESPIFPYREPDVKTAAETLGAKNRLLRIYFLAEARYEGELYGAATAAWTGKVGWANKLKQEDRKKLLELLDLASTTGPSQMFLTEFEDEWPYQKAASDLTFSPSRDQNAVTRPPRYRFAQGGWPTDASIYALAALLIVPPVVRRWRREA